MKMKNRSKIKRTYVVLTVAIVVLTSIVGQFSWSCHKKLETSAPLNNITLNTVPKVIHSKNTNVEPHSRLLVKNSPVDGVKINKSNKYIPEKNKKIVSKENELILFVRYADEASVRTSLDRLGLSLVRILQSDGTVIAHNPNPIQNSAEEINRLAKKDDNILYIMDNCIRMNKAVVSTSNSKPNDPYYSSLWYLKDGAGANVESAWETTQGSDEVLVAVIDSGIVPTHEEFEGRIYKQYDVCDNDGDATDTSDFSHGTHVAGTIAANSNNGIGICGVASGVKLLVIDAFFYDETEDTDVADDADIFTAYELCIDEEVDIVNMSFGGLATDMDYFSRKIYEKKLSALKNNNIVAVAAAGNEGVDDLVYPSDADSVISVIATDQKSQKCDFSNYGSKKDISAPGKTICSVGNATTYYNADGTSMAAPIVSGTAALLLSRKSDLTPDEIEDILFATATRLGKSSATKKDNNFGYGKINAGAAMKYVNDAYFAPTPAPTLELTQTPCPTIVPTPVISEVPKPVATSTPNAAQTMPVETPEVTATPGTTATPEVTATPTSDATPETTATPTFSTVPEVSTTPKISESPEIPATPEIVKEKLNFKKKKLTIKLGKKKMSKISTNITKITWKVVQKKKIIKIVKKYKKKVLIKGRKVGKAKLYAISKLTGKKKKCVIKVRR